MAGAFAEGVGSGQEAELEVVAHDNGQQDALACGQGFGDEVVCRDLIGQGVVEQDGLGLLPLWGGNQLPNHLAR